MYQGNLIPKTMGNVIESIFTRQIKIVRQKKQAKIPFQEFFLAGYQYHRAEGVWSFLQIGEALHLRREPHNQHDPNAIAVYFKRDMLGYIPSNENCLLAQMMDHGEKLEVCITQLLSNSKPWRAVKFSVFSGNKRCI